MRSTFALAAIMAIVSGQDSTFHSTVDLAAPTTDTAVADALVEQFSDAL